MLQTIKSGNSYSHGTTSTSFVDIQSSSGVAWEQTITPSSSSNKIFVIPSLYIRSLRSGGEHARFGLKIQGKIGSGSYADILNGSVTNGRLGGYDYGGGGLQIISYYCMSQLWSPNTTSECKIKFVFKSDTSSTTTATNEDNYESVCLLQEIKG